MIEAEKKPLSRLEEAATQSGQLIVKELAHPDKREFGDWVFQREVAIISAPHGSIEDRVIGMRLECLKRSEPGAEPVSKVAWIDQDEFASVLQSVGTVLETLQNPSEERRYSVTELRHETRGGLIFGLRERNRNDSRETAFLIISEEAIQFRNERTKEFSSDHPAEFFFWLRGAVNSCEQYLKDRQLLPL